MKHLLSIFTAFFIAHSALADGQNSAAKAPIIPEPMVFDMMRPMGAPKGELEANMLAIQPFKKQKGGRSRATEWAPEIEYAYADGHAIEFELPFEGSNLAEYKLGLQGTFGMNEDATFIHGWQYLGMYDKDNHHFNQNLLYMAGTRYSTRWSSLSMLGAQRIDLGAEGRNNLLVNHAHFYDASPETVLGFEVNLSQGSQREWLAIPQIHYALNGHITMQYGAGMRKLSGDKARPVASVRLIREF